MNISTKPGNFRKILVSDRNVLWLVKNRNEIWQIQTLIILTTVSVESVNNIFKEADAFGSFCLIFIRSVISNMLNWYMIKILRSVYLWSTRGCHIMKNWTMKLIGHSIALDKSYIPTIVNIRIICRRVLVKMTTQFTVGDNKGRFESNII